MTKTYSVTTLRRGRYSVQTDTIENLVKCFKYTLEVGQSWQHEKGNKKINLNPKTLKSLVTNLNNADTNVAANGCPTNTYYEGVIV